MEKAMFLLYQCGSFKSSAHGAFDSTQGKLFLLSEQLGPVPWRALPDPRDILRLYSSLRQ